MSPLKEEKEEENESDNIFNEINSVCDSNGVDAYSVFDTSINLEELLTRAYAYHRC